MNTTEILESIDAEIARLEKAKALLAGNTPKTSASPMNQGTSIKTKGPKRRTMSAEGRARIAAAQKARWAKAKR